VSAYRDSRPARGIPALQCGEDVNKFVIRPAAGQANMGEFIDRFVAELVPRQN
jgi:hypothetical protein